MTTNYFKTAFRNILLNKGFSAINIAGLALGICCSLLIILWVQDERKVDSFHANGEYLYQVYERYRADGKVSADYSTQGLLATELKRAIPEIQHASGFEYASMPGTLNTFEANSKINKMAGFYAAEDFLTMFSYPVLHGNTAKALTAPGSIAISRNMAEVFFGSVEKAIGKIVRYENKEELQVTAVFENLPHHSTQRFDFLRSWVDFVKQNKWVYNWGNTSPATFVQLRSGADRADVEAKIKDFVYRYQAKDQSSVVELALQPYTERYLHSTFKDGVIDGGRIEYVRMFTIVAVFILLIACINFMNLATARSAKRAKEVGVRKVIGASRAALIRQFMGEAILLVLLATVFAFCLAFLLLPAFNSFTGKHLVLPVSEPFFWITISALVLITGFVAGSYPALYLSSLNATRVLKGALRFGWTAIFFRKALVVFQFALSLILIVGTIVIYRQMNYISSANLGYDRDNLVYIPIEGELISHYNRFKDEALRLRGIVNVSKMRNSPTVIAHHTGSIEWAGKSPNVSISFADAVVGYDFAKTLDLKFKEGRDFARNFGTDSTSYLLNETAAKRIGFQNPIGQTVFWGNRPGKIIGVLKDFHFQSMHHSIEPLIIRLDEKWGWGTILVRIQGDQVREAIAGLEGLCKSLNPKVPFTYQFSDHQYAQLYASEQMVSKLSKYFAFLAILISCLGLLGLAAFTAEQRTKEIGIRKVLGASGANIVTLLSTHFLKPVSLAMLIAFPIAWYFTNQWLQDFAYKAAIEWWIFAAAGLVTICIALFTVSFQSVKAAMKNPVKSLRTE